MALSLTCLTETVFDKAKEIYGNKYGWNRDNQHYIAPVTGIYRIAFNVYYQTIHPGENQRVFALKNGFQFAEPGFISITDNSLDQSAFVMGLVTLYKDDIIDFRCSNDYQEINAESEIRIWAGIGHTFILIESLYIIL